MHRSPSVAAPSGLLTRPGRRAGSALVMAMAFTVLALSLILAGVWTMKSTRVTTETWFRLRGQAFAFARAGLVEGMAWFRKQTSQPVLAFAPQLNPSAAPPVLDTDDPSIGLVREFQISGSLWGRYEVPLAEVMDISGVRGAMAGTGTCWLLRADGFVFRRNSPTLAYNAFPNQLLSRTRLQTEIRRMSLTPPVNAAIVSARADAIVIAGANAQVYGNGQAAVGYIRNTGSATLGGDVQGGTAIIPPDPADPIPTAAEALGTAAIFGGLLENEVKATAHLLVNDNASFPNPVPKSQIVFADCSLVFNGTRPLKLTGGNSIVYVKGDLTINASNDSCYFSGFIYVTGNLTINAVSVIRGQIVCLGQVRVTGVVDTAQVEFDDTILNNLMVSIGEYRPSTAMINPYIRE